MKRLFFVLHSTDSGQHRTGYWIWNIFWLIAAPILIGIMCLLLSYGDYSYLIFQGYFDNPFLFLMNVLPAVWLMLILYAATNRAWPAFLVTGAVSLIPAAANYFKLRFRDETLVFSDIQYLREGTNISSRYALTMDWKLWLAVALLFLGVLGLGLLVRGRQTWHVRAVSAAILLIGLIPMTFAYRNSRLYYYTTANPVFNTTWATTEYTVSKGFWYSFLYSINDIAGQKPEGYNKKEVQGLLDSYEDADIPADKKVDILAIQLEAFCDLTTLDIHGIDPQTYAIYHELEQQSYTGNLITSTFAAGTILTERSFLTGLYYCETVRRNTDSFVWYLRDQGYQTSFSHGSNDWFYNRTNVCDYLGFSEQYFLENYFGEITGGGIAYDNVYLPAVYDLYDSAGKASDQPCFSMNVTYQGHGPYASDRLLTDEIRYTGDVSEESSNILNNYLASVADTQDCLRELTDKLRSHSRPVILVLYGDHKPWLGDGNSVYTELGVDLNTEHEEGFYNYYSTRYLIWANDAAREILGTDLIGRGPDISPMYLMGLVFDCCGWQGPGYMQLQREWREILPVISSAGYTVQSGMGVTYGNLSQTAKNVFAQCYCVNYFKRNNFTMR